MLDKMYELNLVYFKELTMYILAGKKKLAEVRANDLKAAQEKAQRTQLPEDAQAPATWPTCVTALRRSSTIWS